MTDYACTPTPSQPVFTDASASAPSYDCNPVVDDPTYSCTHVGSAILQENGRAIFTEDGLTPLVQEDAL